jgi:hypothetical protein
LKNHSGIPYVYHILGLGIGPRIALDPERVGDEWGMMLKVERGLIIQNAVLIGVENF